MGKCKICASDTNAIFNIGFKPVSICEECASSIALQQITDVLTRTNLADDICEHFVAPNFCGNKKYQD